MFRCKLTVESMVSEAEMGLLPEEYAPYLRIFFSGHLSQRRDVWNVTLPKKGTSIAFDVRTDDVPTSSVDGTWACIGIATYCKLKIRDDRGNDYGYSRYEPIAGCMIHLSDIMIKGTKRFQLRMEDRTGVSGSAPLDRGELLITVSDVSWSGFQLVGTYSEGIRNQRERRMKALIAEHARRFRSELLPTRENCAPMHIKTYYTEISGIKIPACGFALSSTIVPHQDGSYVEYLVRAAIEIAGWREGDFIEAVLGPRSHRFAFACKIVAAAVCLASNACDYVSDHSFKDDAERFIHLVHTLAGDCEDSAVMAYLTWTHISISPVPDRERFPIAHAAWYICTLYVAVAFTGIATCPALGGKKGEKRDVCHIYGSAIPRIWFARALGDEEFEAKLIEERPVEEGEGEIPYLMLEGTNFCSALVGQLSAYLPEDRRKDAIEAHERMMLSIRTAEMAFRDLSRLSITNQNQRIKDPTFHAASEEEFSDFYRRPVELWTDALLRRGIGYANFSIGYGTQTKGTERDGYGVDFRDLVSLSKDITIVPTFGISQEDYDIMANVLDQEMPIKMESSVGTLKLAVLDKLSVLKAKYPRKIGGNRASEVPDHVSYFVNHEKKLTEAVLRALESALSGGYYAGMDYAAYPLTADGELYVIHISLGIG